MGRVEFAPKLGWIGRQWHRLGIQDRLDGSSPQFAFGREPIQGLANDGRDGYSAAFGLARDLLVPLIIEKDLQAMVEHTPTLTHV
jgi:hypothetical protein